MKNFFYNVLFVIGELLSRLFNIKIKLKFILPVLIILVGGTAFYVHKTMIENVGGKDFYEEAARYVEIKDLVEKNFISEVSRDKMSDSASASIVAGLGDKWSYYMTPSEYNSYNLYSTNEYSSIGMSLTEVDNGFQVVTVSSGSAASDAGLGAGMVINTVDGQNIIGKDIDTVRTLIRSKLNTKFTLGIANGDNINIDCSRTYISSVSSRLEKTEAGYVQIKNFEAGTGQDAIDAIEHLLDQGAVSLVLDVRNNPGGLAGEIQTLLDYLLPSCDLFYIADNAGNRTAFKSDSMCIQLPICVLINKSTFAEAEVFAACLQDYGWATILGENTDGMTRMQQTFILSDGSAVRLSTKAYITSKGVDIYSNGGVVPEMIVHNADESATGTTAGTTGISDGSGVMSADDQLMAALRYLS